MPLRYHFQDNIRAQLKTPRFMRFAMDAMRVLDEMQPKFFIRMEDGEQVPILFEHVFCQTFRNDSSLEDRVYTAMAWQHVLLGNYVYRVLQVRESPGGDRDVGLNQSILDGALRRYADEPDIAMLEAKYYGGGYDQDGVIEFAKPFISAAEPNDVHTAKAIRCSFPLEVGYCRPDQMFYHLARSRCVARFPYNYRYIVFVENVMDEADRLFEVDRKA